MPLLYCQHALLPCCLVLIPDTAASLLLRATADCMAPCTDELQQGQSVGHWSHLHDVSKDTGLAVNL